MMKEAENHMFMTEGPGNCTKIQSYRAESLYKYVSSIPMKLENADHSDYEKAFYPVPMVCLVRLEDSKDLEVQKYLKKVDELQRAHSVFYMEAIGTDLVSAHLEIKCEIVDLETLTYDTIGSIDPNNESTSFWDSSIVTNQKSELPEKKYPHTAKIDLPSVYQSNLNSYHITKNSVDKINNFLLESTSYKDPEFMSRFASFTDEDMNCDFYNMDFSVSKSEELQFFYNKSGRTMLKAHQCEVCQKAFRAPSALKRHMVVHTGEKSHLCNICHKSFSDPSHLRNHIPIHTEEKPYCCNDCGKTFRCKRYLKSHVSIHTRMKPFQCEVCLKVFSSKQNLNAHVVIHSKNGKYRCDFCQKAFRHRNYWNSHMITHTGVMPFECNLCYKTFSRKSTLNRHALLHTHNTKYQCNVCLKEFTQKYYFKRHIPIHNRERNKYQCDVCEKTLSSKSSLKKHLFSHTGVGPFQCRVCRKAFTQQSTFNKHLLIHA